MTTDQPKLSRKSFLGSIFAGSLLPRITPVDDWRQFDGEPLYFDGVAVCLFADEDSVALIPEDEDESDQWPVNVLRLSMARQRAIVDEIEYWRER